MISFFKIYYDLIMKRVSLELIFIK